MRPTIIVVSTLGFDPPPRVVDWHKPVRAQTFVVPLPADDSMHSAQHRVVAEAA